MTGRVEYYNKIYQEKGFNGIIRTVERQLHLGRVTWNPSGIVRITTGGWSDDEEIISHLIDVFSKFSQFHYIGEIRGGAYYFAEHMECSMGNFEIVESLSDEETCNPRICYWCCHADRGKRNPSYSITLCDGCRYNEEFEHKQMNGG